MARILSVLSLLLLVACPTVQQTATVDRIYVINCGENHAKDLSAWTPGAHVGEPYVFSNYCYLIRHANQWMLWDSGNPDRVAGMPNGLPNPRGTIIAFMRKPLVDSLREIGVAPADIQHFAMSHSHGDHSGNANLFYTATIYMQRQEFDAVFGPEPQKYNFIAANFEKLRGAKILQLNGDHDVFGDGAVVIKSTPGHTPGHQSLLVRLPKTGPVLLSGDMTHLMENWKLKRAPSFNFDVPQSVRSMQEMETFMQRTGAKLWINHDREQSASIPKAPAYVQ
jgi:glyoxylase-like metal-dependent hydrolase (beta-lactamase superfamily II)